MAAIYWRDLRFLVHFRKSHLVIIAVLVRREFISIRIRIHCNLSGERKKKKNLGDISLTIPSNSGGEFQFWNAKIANSPINLLRRIFRGIFFLFFFFFIINVQSSRLSRVLQTFRLHVHTMFECIYIQTFHHIYINSRSVSSHIIIIWNKFRSVHGWIFTGLRYRMERAMR